MKTNLHTTIALGLGLALAPALWAQAFNSGSDGSFGPINVTTGDVTIDLPPDGVIHATTVNVGSGRTLRFKRNALNTPVTLLATGDVTIAGIVDVSGGQGSTASGGLGGPGGFAGGMPGGAGTPPGDGQGPGAGRAGQNNTSTEGAGHGVYAIVPNNAGSSTRHGTPYGSALLVPILGGSGGGGSEGTPGFGGGGGGGALLLASSTRIHLTGIIVADGGRNSGSSWNGGSGGAVRLVAPVVSGNGVVRVRGAQGFSNAAGRIRVDTLDRTGLSVSLQPDAVAAIGSLMMVQPSPLPRLDVIEVAGNAIPEGSGPVVVTLPFGAPASQTVKVRARDLGQVVPLRLVLTPESGASRSYDFDINNAAANPAEATVTVEFPANTSTHVAVWTR